MKHRIRTSLAIAALLVSGCTVGAIDGEWDEDAITAEELRAGEAWTIAGDGVEPDVHIDDDMMITGIDVPDVDTTFGAESALPCRNATGYRSGHRMTVCVTQIDGKWVEVHTARHYLQMRAAAKHDGVYLQIVSGFRTMKKQRELYQCYLAHRCPLAAPPGFSNHQSGHALDLNTSAPHVYSWLSRHASAYGFQRTVPSEAWHWEHW